MHLKYTVTARHLTLIVLFLVIGSTALFFGAMPVPPADTRFSSNYGGFVSPLGAGAGFAMPACGGSTPNNPTTRQETGKDPAGTFNNPSGSINVDEGEPGVVRNSNGNHVKEVRPNHWTRVEFKRDNQNSSSGGTGGSSGGGTGGGTTTNPPPPPGTPMPGVVLEVKNITTNSSWTRNDLTIREGQDIALRWRSHNAQVCTAENFETGGVTGGETQQVEEPPLLEQRAYTIRCENSGRVAAEQIIVETLPEPPTARLEVRNTTRDMSWTREKIIIGELDEVHVRWSSENANQCSGTHFTTGGATDGIDETVEEPAVGTERTYLLRCTNEGGSDNDEVRVIKPFFAPDLFTSHRIIRLDGVATLTWDLKGNDPAACTLEGPDVSRTTLVGISEQRVRITGQSIFTLDCPGGVSSVRIRTVGQTFES